MLAQHGLLPPTPVQNESHPALGNIEVPSNINSRDDVSITRPPAHHGSSRTSSIKCVQDIDGRPARQQLLRNLEAPDTLVSKLVSLLEPPAKDMQSYPDQQFPYKAIPRSRNKSVRLCSYQYSHTNHHFRSKQRSTMKQAFPPFPDVLQQANGRNLTDGTPATNRQASATDSHPLQSVDINRRLHGRDSSNHTRKLSNGNDIGPQDETKAPLDTTIDVPRSQPHVLLCPQNSVQQATVHDNPAPAGGFGLQENTIIPIATNWHHNEAQREWSQISDQQEQTLLHNGPEDGKETLYRQGNNEAQISIVDLRSQSDRGLHHTLPPLSRSPSRSRSVLSNTARPMVRPLVIDELVPEGIPEYQVLHLKQPMRVQKSNDSPSHSAQRVKSNYEQINQRSNSSSTASSIQAFRQNLVQIEETLGDYEHKKSLIKSQQGELQSQRVKLQSQQKDLESQELELESRQAEIAKLKRATADSNRHIKSLEEEKTALTVKVKKFTEISARYKAHMNEVVIAQKHLIFESSKIKDISSNIREESQAILKVHAGRENRENTLRNLINNAKSIRPSVEKLAECQ